MNEESQNQLATTVAVMGNDISTIKQGIGEIKITMQALASSSVNRQEHSEVVEIQKDHEVRTRSLEKTQTQILTFGTVGMMALTVLGILIDKFWK
jgi:hypothetical protein